MSEKFVICIGFPLKSEGGQMSSLSPGSAATGLTVRL